MPKRVRATSDKGVRKRKQREADEEGDYHLLDDDQQPNREESEDEPVQETAEEIRLRVGGLQPAGAAVGATPAPPAAAPCAHSSWQPHSSCDNNPSYMLTCSWRLPCCRAAKQYLDNIRAAEQEADGDDEDGAVAEQLRQDALEVRASQAAEGSTILCGFSRQRQQAWGCRLQKQLGCTSRTVFTRIPHRITFKQQAWGGLVAEAAGQQVMGSRRQTVCTRMGCRQPTSTQASTGDQYHHPQHTSPVAAGSSPTCGTYHVPPHNNCTYATPPTPHHMAPRAILHPPLPMPDGFPLPPHLCVPPPQNRRAGGCSGASPTPSPSPRSQPPQPAAAATLVLGASAALTGRQPPRWLSQQTTGWRSQWARMALCSSGM
jgi:hypothetical protein